MPCFLIPKPCCLWLVVLWMSASAAPSLAQSTAESHLSTIRSVGKNGTGNEAAAAAMGELNKSDASAIPMVLQAFNGATPLQHNWLMGVINRAATRGPLPEAAVKSFFMDRSNDSIGRLVAFELLAASDATLKADWTPKLIDDPSLPLRHIAIAQLIDQAKSLKDDDSEAAAVLLKKAIGNALNVTQLQQAAKLLRGEGVKVNLQQVMGFLNRWRVVGTFDNTESAGFDVAYGPEKELASIKETTEHNNEEYQNADGESVTWQQTKSNDDAGVVDLNKIIGNKKDSTVYASASFNSPLAGAAQLRLGSPNATKVWLNGKLVMTNEVYHNSNSIDKFVADVDLKKGANEILIKVCQNNQTQPWAQDWQYQMRFCDLDSKPIVDESLYQAADDTNEGMDQ